MPHKLPVPDEARLERLITAAFEQAPAPEMLRLKRIEEDLSRKLLINKPVKRVNRIPWWIVLLLGGGVATAAWWAGEVLTDRGTEVQDTFLPDPGIETTEGKTGGTENAESQHYDHKDSPVIYQRENY